MRHPPATPYSVARRRASSKKSSLSRIISKRPKLHKNCTFFISVELEAFTKFKDTKEALKATATMLEGRLPKKLKKFLNKNIISKEV